MDEDWVGKVTPLSLIFIIFQYSILKIEILIFQLIIVISTLVAYGTRPFRNIILLKNNDKEKITINSYIFNYIININKR